jgi:enterochelin esterase family protein
VTAALRRLSESGWPDAQTLDDFLASAQFPIVERTSVTFVWRGEADGVRLRHSVYGLPSSQPFERLPGSDLWWLTLDLPPGSRMEYKLLIERGGDVSLILDPLNPHTAHDPYGRNSVVHGEGYETPEWTFPDPDARSGTLREMTVHSRALGGEKPVTLYLPARYRPERRYPLLVVLDGLDYLRFAGMKTVLDNLVHRLEIPPLLAAFTQSSDRLREYAANDAHGRFLVEELVPAVEAEYRVEAGPAGRGLMGASFGGVASLHAAWRHPGAFGRLLLQSGSFAFTDIGQSARGPLFEPVVSFVNRFRQDPGRPAERLFVTCGVYESLIYENRSMVPLLQATGMDVRYVESRDGHNWENWRDRLREGLSWLFPGPLWMIYE